MIKPIENTEIFNVFLLISFIWHGFLFNWQKKW